VWSRHRYVKPRMPSARKALDEIVTNLRDGLAARKK
jgi:hypothetical protein